MNEKPIPQTPEAVAYQLMLCIFLAENKATFHDGFGTTKLKATLPRQEILDTYKECLRAVKNPE